MLVGRIFVWVEVHPWVWVCLTYSMGPSMYRGCCLTDMTHLSSSAARAPCSALASGAIGAVAGWMLMDRSRPVWVHPYSVGLSPLHECLSSSDARAPCSALASGTTGAGWMPMKPFLPSIICLTKFGGFFYCIITNDLFVFLIVVMY